MDEKKTIAIIGSGFAGTWSALAARNLLSSHPSSSADIDVVVVSPEPRLVMRPRLYQADPAAMAVDLQDLFSTHAIRHVRASVTTIHHEKRSLQLIDAAGEESSLMYDRLVLAAGSQLAAPKLTTTSEHVFNIDTLESAVKLETHLQSLPSSHPPSRARATALVCGAGFTGLELAAELPSRLRSVLGPDAPAPRVILVSREPEPGASLGAGPLPAITRALTKLGVELRLGTTVTCVDAHGALLSSGERIEALTTIWTAGVRASLLAGQVPGEHDAVGRLVVDQHLRVPSSPHIFASGDSACAAVSPSGPKALMSCQHALALGRVSGHNAAADLLGLPTRIYSQPLYVTCLDLGPGRAVLTAGWDRKVVLSGWLAKAVKKFINGWLIYPPGAGSSTALSQADPGQYVSAPMLLAQRLGSTFLLILAFVRSLFV